MEEKLFEKLKELLGETQLSDKTIREISLGRLSRTIRSEEELSNANFSEEVELLKSIEGQLNWEVAQRLKSVESQVPPQASAPPPSPSIPNTSSPPLSEELLRDISELKKFHQNYIKEQREKRSAAKREKLFNDVREKLISGGCHDELMVRIAMESIDYDADLQSNVSQLTQTYNQELSRYIKSQGYVPKAQGSPTPQTKTPKEVEAEQKAMIQEYRTKGLI